jgi:hypothetical protein
LLSRDGDARLLVAQDWETIVQELRTAIAEAVAELQPIDPAEVTDRVIIRITRKDDSTVNPSEPEEQDE